MYNKLLRIVELNRFLWKKEGVLLKRNGIYYNLEEMFLKDYNNLIEQLEEGLEQVETKQEKHDLKEVISYFKERKNKDY